MGHRDRPPGRRGRCELEPRSTFIYDERHDYPVTTDSRVAFASTDLFRASRPRVWVSPIAGFLSGTIAKALVLKPGEVRDLGDVREKQVMTTDERGLERPLGSL